MQRMCMLMRCPSEMRETFKFAAPAPGARGTGCQWC
jgi:hypothetical protein